MADNPLFQHCLPGIRKAWETGEPDRDRWADWLQRPVVKTEQMFVERLAFTANLPPTSVILDLGCGPGRYCHVLPYAQYFGMDAWDEAIEYAKDWAWRAGKATGTRGEGGDTFFVLGSVFDDWPCTPDLVLTMNVFRHFKHPFAAYEHVWDHLPVGSVWITDFLTTPLDRPEVRGETSYLIPEAAMFDFLNGKTHEPPFPYFKEVGPWWLTRLIK